MKDENKSVLGWATNCGAKIMALCVGVPMGAGRFCILSLCKFTGQAEVHQHRVADMLGAVGRDRPSGGPLPPIDIYLLFFPFFPPEFRSNLFNQP